MKIKTIRRQLDYAEDFDAEVNEALEDGWMLRKREVLMPNTSDKYIMLYVELERHPQPEAPDLDAAIKALALACKSAPSCGEECPLNDWCQRNLPDTRYAPQDWIEET